MKAIIQDRGRQYPVDDGSEYLVDLMADVEVGSEVVFDKVLLLDDKVGTPFVSGASVTATVLAHEKGKKIYVEKFHRRKDYRRRVGHRQKYTRISIASISG